MGTKNVYFKNMMSQQLQEYYLIPTLFLVEMIVQSHNFIKI